MTRIGLSYADGNDSYEKYPAALAAAAEGLGMPVQHVWLSGGRAPHDALSDVDAVLFTGGGDIDPQRFGRSDLSGACAGINLARDTTELRLAQEALARKLPVLAICRGAQLLNVSQGGTLLVDIRGHSGSDGVDAEHVVQIAEDSVLRRIVGSPRAAANSSHHQAVGRIAERFRATAIADDGIIEGFELREPAGQPFLLAVQWHPERLGSEIPAGGGIFRAFLAEAGRL
ncbi:MAG TPA: gamma-glutamyl-gamma-aminobutyrate hydrolase family protein [Candidatus Baltobacteraceae bacterium]|jgi:putative glutamine amidotransferase